MRILIVSVLVAGALAGARIAAQESNAPGAADVTNAIDLLGSLEYSDRMNASRTVRRAETPVATPALFEAVESHRDGYVRYRALVLLSGFPHPRVKDTMRQALFDQNDRLRTVAYKYFEHNPDPAVVPQLIEGLEREESEFVRPALVRALAAHGDDPRVREKLLVEVDRGVDFFRSAVIEALGDYRAEYAFASLARVANLDGPLQNEAALALGKIGDKRALDVLAALQRSAPKTSQPEIAAAICLLGVNCSSHQPYLEETLLFSVENVGFQDLLRGAASGLAALAAGGNERALVTLLDQGVPSADPARAAIALAVGAVALRNVELTLNVLQKRHDLPQALLLLRDAFDMLEEDMEEERFFVHVRRTYWEAADGSPIRATGEALIETLEF